MSRDFFLDTTEVLRYLNQSSALFGDEHGSVLPIDTGAVMHRQVTCDGLKTPFIEWFVQHVVNALEDPESLKQKDRVFFVSGRAGQGKSTVLRKLFLAILGQWEEEPRERPNFSGEMDNKLTSFFNSFQDSTFFAQGRALPVDASLVNGEGNRRLIFIDGLDESTRQIQFISAMISKNPNTVFVLSSRSKYDDLEGDEVINMGLLQQTLADAGANGSVSAKIAHLGELTHLEKNNMFDLLKRFDGHASYGMLESLAKNNSPLLQRPADFLLFRAKKPTTKPQYYIEHLSWLLRREMAKDEDRKERVKSLQFPSFLEKLELSNEKLRMKYNSEETLPEDIESMVLFNLIEQDWSGKNADNYLDITTPASRGLLLLESSGRYSVQDLVKHGSVGLIDVGECVKEFVFGKGRNCFNQMFQYILNDNSNLKSTQRMHQIVSTMVSGSLDESVNSQFLEFVKTFTNSENDGSTSQFNSAINFGILLADIFHPVDELDSEINVERYSSCLVHVLKYVHRLQKKFTHCQSVNEQGTECNQTILGHYMWPNEDTIYEHHTLSCHVCGTATDSVGSHWFDDYLPHYASLVARISQIGPQQNSNVVVRLRKIRNKWIPRFYSPDRERFSDDFHKSWNQSEFFYQNENGHILFFTTGNSDSDLIQLPGDIWLISTCENINKVLDGYPEDEDSFAPTNLSLLLRCDEQDDTDREEIRKLAFSFVEEGERFFYDPAGYLNAPRTIFSSGFELVSIQTIRTMLARYAVEIGSKSYDTIFRVLRLGQSMLPRFKNNNSMNRTFVFLNSILGISDYEPYSAENSSSMFTSYRKLKTVMFEWMLPMAKFPSDWDSEIYQNLNFRDVVYSHYSLMGTGSMNSNKIVQFYLDDGMNPNVTYPGHSPSLRDRMSAQRANMIYQADYPMRSSKFIGKIVENDTLPRLESLLSGLITVSRVGHLNPRDVAAFYSTTLDADIGKHVYANPSNPKGLMNDLLSDQKDNWPNVPSEIPPAFIQKPRMKTGVSPEYIHKLSLFLKEDHTLANLYISPYPDQRRQFQHEILPYLNSERLSPRAFLESYTSVAPFFMDISASFGGEDKRWYFFNKYLSNIDQRIKQGFVEYLESGDFFPATILSTRAHFPHITSILFSIESPSDGFLSRSNKFLGNYLNRRVWNGFVDHDPNNRTFFRRFGIQKDDRPKFESLVPTLHDPLYVSYEQEIHKGHKNKNFLSKKIRHRLTTIPSKKVDSFEDGNFVAKFELIEDMHQDNSLSAGKQRNYSLSTSSSSVRGSISHSAFAEIWAHLVQQKASELGITLKKEKLQTETLIQAFTNPVARVGDLLKRGNMRILNSWHTAPFFQKKWRFTKHRIMDWEHRRKKDELDFLYHLACDRILEGCNVNLETKPTSPSLMRMQGMNLYSIKHHTIDANPSPSSGFVELMFDENFFEEENDVEWKWVCSDLNNFHPGLRVVYSDRTQIMRSHFIQVPSKPKSLKWDMFRWTTTKISSLRFAHLKSRENEDTKDRQIKWIHYDPSDFNWQFNNPVYGEKIGISPKNGGSQGLAEFASKGYTSSKGAEINALIEVDNHLWNRNPLFAHSSWKDHLLMAREVNQHFQAEALPSSFTSGARLDRVFGFITDTGGVDQYVVSRIKDRIKLFEENAAQLENDQRVVSGRANMLNCLRDISTYFTYSNWYPGYIEAYQTLRGEFESVLTRIEKTEKEKMGKSLPGTKADFKIVRAVLVGIRKKYLIFQEKLEQRRVTLVENSTAFKFNDILKEVRELGVYYDDEKMRELYADLIKAGIGANSYERSKLQSKCRPTRKLSVRVLGLSQQMHPYAIQTWWGEAIGALAQDKDNAQVGSLVRLDLKKMQKEGTSKAIVANIGYASEELNDKGELQKKYAMLSGEATNQWPDPLPNDTWLKLGEDISERMTERVVPLHILFDKGYAFHPSLEVEIPIFDMERVPENLHHGELRTCTIDVRRDRSRGLYRYYVTHIE